MTPLERATRLAAIKARAPVARRRKFNRTKAPATSRRRGRPVSNPTIRSSDDAVLDEVNDLPGMVEPAPREAVRGFTDPEPLPEQPIDFGEEE